MNITTITFIILSIAAGFLTPTKTLSNQNKVSICCVCIKEIEEKNPYLLDLLCHTCEAHEECMQQWLKEKGICPLCNTEVHGILILLSRPDNIAELLIFGEQIS